MIYLLDGVRIHPDLGFVKNGTQYPPGWIHAATADERAAVGIETRNDAPQPDSRWYISSQKADGTWNATPRDIASSREQYKAIVKRHARDKILAICPEWKQTNTVARGVEVVLGVITTGQGVSPAVAAEIQAGLVMWASIKAIRQRSDQIEAEIDELLDNTKLSYEDKVAGLELRLSPDYVGWSA